MGVLVLATRLVNGTSRCDGGRGPERIEDIDARLFTDTGHVRRDKEKRVVVLALH
jgi:hypothetical protein